VNLPIRAVSLAAFFCGLALPLSAGVVVVLDQDGAYKFVSGEAIQFNGKDRVRLCTAAPTYLQKQVGSCQVQRLAALPLIRRDFVRNELITTAADPSLTVLPDSVKADGDSNTLWAQAPGAIGTGRSKQGDPLPNGVIIAILTAADTEDALRAFLSDEANFTDPKGKAQTLALQGRLIAAAIKEFPQAAKIRALREDSLAKLKAAVDEFEQGLMEANELGIARQRVESSTAVFPTDPEFQAQRDRFAALEKSLAKRRAILRALATGSQWDAYLNLYSQLQRYEFLFPEFNEMQRKALTMSRDHHKTMAQARLDVKDCGTALAHLRLALKRDPQDLAARELSESARVCLVRAPRTTRTSSKLGVASDNAPALRTTEFVDRFIAEGKLESAERSLREGLGQYPNFPPLLLSQVRLLEKLGKFREALSILDRYDSLVSVEAEWDKGDRARRDMEFQILKGRDERGSKLTTLLKENRFESALALVKEGLRSDPEDHELLFRAGILSLLKRERTEARGYLLKYLDAAQSLSGSPERRKQAFTILGKLDTAPPPAPTGKPHWFSNAPIAPHLAYDPASLQFARRIDKVIASNKQLTEFRWSGEHLEAIQTTADEKPPRLLSRFKFEYDPSSQAVSRVFDATVENSPGQVSAVVEQKKARTIFDDPIAATPTAEAAEKSTRSPDLVTTLAGPGLPVLLANHPALDIVLVEEFMDTRLGHVIAGNKYFHPFSWDQPRLFRVSYDSAGRIRRAFPAGPDVKVPEVYDFAWQGDLLQSIAIFTPLPNGEPDLTKPLYRRSMRYSDGRLIAETTTPPTGKPATIEYKYQGQQLLSAEASEDATLDNRSRKVSFLP